MENGEEKDKKDGGENIATTEPKESLQQWRAGRALPGGQSKKKQQVLIQNKRISEKRTNRGEKRLFVRISFLHTYLDIAFGHFVAERGGGGAKKEFIFGGSQFFKLGETSSISGWGNKKGLVWK